MVFTLWHALSRVCVWCLVSCTYVSVNGWIGEVRPRTKWAALDTQQPCSLSFFFFFLYHYPAPLTLSVTFNYRAFTFLAFISVFCVFISSVYSFTVPPFCSCCLFFQKAQWSHCFSHYFYSHWGYKWTKSYSSSHQPIKEMPGACERRQQTHTQQAVPGTV